MMNKFITYCTDEKSFAALKARIADKQFERFDDLMVKKKDNIEDQYDRVDETVDKFPDAADDFIEKAEKKLGEFCGIKGDEIIDGMSHPS
jgi:hypothetical protein